MSVARQIKYYTVDDVYNLPEGQRAELIDGELYMMASPGRLHQRVVGALYRKIADYVDGKKGSCEVNIAPFAVFLNGDDYNYVEPDLVVVCDKDKLTDKGCNGAPDWIIEVVSPTSRPMDYYKKLLKYRTAGVREYWVVDYEKNHVIVYDFARDKMRDYSLSDKVEAGIYDDLEIDFLKLDVE